MSITTDYLYQLLPEIYRKRDLQNGEALKSLMHILGEQASLLENEIERLYDNQFIETCEEWAVPYIGDLVGYKFGHDIEGFSQRAAAANQIRLVRRKGTALVLEQLALDVTGWHSRVVEFFKLLARPQHLAAVQATNQYTLDFRNIDRLENLSTAFDTANYSVDVGKISSGEGIHNIKNIGIFLWRLNAYPQPRTEAFRLSARRYFFHPLGFNTPLYNLPLPEEAVTHIAEQVNLPIPLKRRLLNSRLSNYYGRAFRIWLDGIEVQESDITICNLSEFAGSWAHTPTNHVVAIDPVLGRIATNQSVADPSLVEVTFHYGFAADIGGGAYSRTEDFATELAPLREVNPGDTIQTEIDLNQAGGIVEIYSSAPFIENLSITVNPDRGFELRAAEGRRPFVILDDDFVISGGAESEVTIDGLTISGGRIIVPNMVGNQLRRLTLRNVTMIPGISLNSDGSPTLPEEASIIIEADNVSLEIEQSIVGSIQAVPSTDIDILNSIVDATDSSLPAISDIDSVSHSGQLCLQQSTVIGKVAARIMSLISNSIIDAQLLDIDTWNAPVWAQQRQTGCSRFSYIPPGSRVPRQHRCQPSFATQKAIEKAEAINPLLDDLTRQRIREGVRARLIPSFSDKRYGQPAYFQLLTSAPIEILIGASSESEMGVYHDLYQPQRADNLTQKLNEFLGTGLEVGLIYST